jgi:hypothetical protein
MDIWKLFFKCSFVLCVYYIWGEKKHIKGFDMQDIWNGHVYNHVLTKSITNWSCGGLVKELVHICESEGSIPSLNNL